MREKQHRSRSNTPDQTAGDLIQHYFNKETALMINQPAAGASMTASA
jgi:hypothetical protein